MRRSPPPRSTTAWNGISATLRLARRQGVGIKLGLEADHELATPKLQHRPLDDRGLRQHQRDRLLLGQAFLLLVGQLAESRAGFVEQALPADLLCPAFQLAALNAANLVIV